MAIFEFTCRQCAGNFDMEPQGIVSGAEELECAHCNFKFHKAGANDFAAALGEFLAQLVALNKKFSFSVTFDSESLDDKGTELDDEEELEEDEEIDEDEDDDDDDEF